MTDYVRQIGERSVQVVATLAASVGVIQGLDGSHSIDADTWRIDYDNGTSFTDSILPESWTNSIYAAAIVYNVEAVDAHGNVSTASAYGQVSTQISTHFKGLEDDCACI